MRFCALVLLGAVFVCSYVACAEEMSQHIEEELPMPFEEQVPLPPGWPRMKIVDQQVSPSCLSVAASWETGGCFGPKHGHDHPFIKIMNICSHSVTIEKFAASPENKPQGKTEGHTSFLLEKIVEGKSEYFGGNFPAIEGDVCSADDLKDNRDKKCRAIVMEADAILKLPVEFNAFYFLTGKPDLHIEGRVIRVNNPQSNKLGK